MKVDHIDVEKYALVRSSGIFDPVVNVLKHCKCLTGQRYRNLRYGEGNEGITVRNSQIQGG